MDDMTDLRPAREIAAEALIPRDPNSRVCELIADAVCTALETHGLLGPDLYEALVEAEERILELQEQDAQVRIAHLEGQLAGEIPIEPEMARTQLTAIECERIGGHCWTSDGTVLASHPPQYPEHCRHCPAYRVGVQREPFTYRYSERPGPLAEGPGLLEA